MIKYASFLLGLLFIFPSVGFGQDCCDYSSYLHLGNTVEISGRINRIVIDDHFAYLAVSDHGLEIYDLSSPESPEHFCSLEIPGPINDLVIDGQFAYMACNENGLKIIDIGDPSAPEIVSGILTEGKAINVTVSGTKAFVSCYGGPIQVFDVEDPLRPKRDWSLLFPISGWKVDVYQNFALILGRGILEIFQMDQLSNVQSVGHYYLQRLSSDFALHGDIVYIATRGYGVTILDISDPSAPKFMGRIESNYSSDHLTIEDNMLYIADERGGVQIVDISDPLNPIFINQIVPRGDMANHVVPYEDFIYVADHVLGLHVIHASNLNSPEPISVINQFYGPQHFQFRGDLAYVAQSSLGLKIYDYSNPENPVSIGGIDTPGMARRVAMAWPCVYVVDDYDLQVIDVSNPYIPEIVTTLTPEGSLLRLATNGSFAYMGVAQNHIQVWDISDPFLPRFASRIENGHRSEGFAFQNNYAFVITSHELQIFDISNAPNMEFVGETGYFSSGNCVTVSGSIAYVGGDYSIRVIDISTPEYPELLTRIRIPGKATDLEVIGNFLYAASGYNCGIQVLDIASPENPVLLGVFNQPGSTVSLSSFRDNMIVATNMQNGLFTLPIHCQSSTGIDDPPGNGQLPDTPSLSPGLSIHPNPFNPRTEISFSNERLQMVMVGIYDLKGRLVKMIANGIFDSGSHSFIWNGLDIQGKSLGSGIYFVRMETEERIWVEKVSLVR